MSAVDQGLPHVKTSSQQGRERIAGLDGLRGVAVLAVMLFHTASSPFQGGFLGVDVFFVLSGYLIGGLLLDEQSRTGGIVLGRFWLRRARRLAPALLALLAVVAVARLAVEHPEASAWRSEILAALTYTTNWFLIATGSDYFSQFGQPQPLLHTWSLAIEEQFYLLFAVLMVFLLKRVRPGTVLVAFAFLTGVSAGWMALVAADDPSWAYYGTATRIQALLVGAALAIIVRRGTETDVAPSARRATAGTWVAAAVLLTAFVLPVSDEALFRGGFLVIALASAAVIRGVAAGGPIAVALSWRPLVAVGAISYGMYLWHWPIFLLLGTSRESSSIGRQMWAFILTTLIAWMSYVVLEKPIRTGKFTRLRPSRQWGTYAVAAGAVALLAILPARTTPVNQQLSWPDAAQVPERVLVAGDSTMLSLLEHFPRERYPETVVGGPLQLGCGIVDAPYIRESAVQAPEKCRGWRNTWRQKVDQIAPEVAFVGSTVWDAYDRYVDGEGREPGTPEFDEAYLPAFREAIALAGRGGQIPVYVVGQSCMSSPTDEVLNDPNRSARLDALIRAAVGSMPNAHYLDTRAITCSAEGTAIDEGSRLRLREDGVHWGQRGSDLFWSTSLSQVADDRAGSEE